ncbi:probable succinate dehydrogenase cytochrome b560 subunit, mitochondrial [Coccomyxa sp. Obi]|nr:probable succinate dehydrogenase cytochrome b560 subunit, mitochondrial [Coccomyxa sp. Obi]
MARAAAQSLSKALRVATTSSSGQHYVISNAAISQHFIRQHGGGVPEFWGKDSPYHPGTDFLGTPKDHLDRVKNRPVSPHVFEEGGTKFHYNMPINAVTSIMNRATGVMLTVGFTGVGWIALTGDLIGTIDAIKSTSPLLVYPVKAAVAFPMVYHYLGGVRHVFWDKAKYGNQAEKNSALENSAVDRSSRLLVGASAIGTLALTVASF